MLLGLGVCEGALATSADGAAKVDEEITDELIARKISLLVVMIEDGVVTATDDEFKDLMAFFKKNTNKIAAWLFKFGTDSGSDNSLIHNALQNKPLENKCFLNNEDQNLTELLKGFLTTYKDSLPPAQPADASAAINLRENGDSATFIPEKPQPGDQYSINTIPFTPFINNTSKNIMISAGTLYAVVEGTSFLKGHGLEVVPDGMFINKNNLVLPAGALGVQKNIVDIKSLKSEGYSFSFSKNGEPLMDISVNLFDKSKEKKKVPFAPENPMPDDPVDPGLPED